MKLRNAILFSVMSMISFNSFGESQTDVVKSQLNAINRVAVSQGLIPTDEFMIDDMENNGSTAWTFNVGPNRIAVIHLVCDNNCRDISAMVYGSDGNMILNTDTMDDDGKPDVWVLPVKNTNNSMAKAIVTVKMNKCYAQSCIYGMSIAEKPL